MSDSAAPSPAPAPAPAPDPAPAPAPAPAPTAAQPPDAFTEAWLPGWDSLNFYTRTYLPPAPTDAPAPAPRAALLFVHGFAEHIGRYAWAHGATAARCVAVFAFDGRGFGQTALGEPARVSRASRYGKTSWAEQLRDVEWWARHVRERFPGVPVFLMGHSMGGGLALGFPTREGAPPSKDTVALLSGVVASSPLFLLPHPASKVARFFGRLASKVVPALVIPAPVNPDHLSHDKEKNEENMRDPMCPQKGSVKGISDMLDGGEQLLWNDYKNWPKSLPLLIVHGTADQVTSFTASQEFYEKVEAEDKQLIPFEDGYHELVNELGDMKVKFVNDCVDWILKHVDGATSA